jgi:Tfp pilus assembly protein PilX
MSVIDPRQSKNLRKNQSGMASILITMITMIVVSLIVLGFATISRREQGNTLDQQLSTQAFYAAETGVEDARSIIMNDVKTNTAIPAKTNCTSNSGLGNYPTGAQTVLDGAHNVSYTCLLVDPTVTSVVYGGIDTQSKVIPINNPSGTPITKLVVNWSPSNVARPSTARCPGSATHTFSPATSWACDYGVLRMDLVPTQGVLTRAGLENNDLTSFFEPLNRSGGGSFSYSGNVGNANIEIPSCTASQCSETITGLAATDSMVLRIISLYKASDVTINAYHGGSLLNITGQVMVDVTGDAGGVLRRIQVRIPTSYSSNLIPDYAIQSNAAICKRFEVDSSYFSVPSDIVNPDPGDAMCQPVTSGRP